MQRQRGVFRRLLSASLFYAEQKRKGKNRQSGTEMNTFDTETKRERKRTTLNRYLIYYSICIFNATDVLFSKRSGALAG